MGADSKNEKRAADSRSNPIANPAVMVLPDGSNLRPFQSVVGSLVMVAGARLWGGGPARGEGMNHA